MLLCEDESDAAENRYHKDAQLRPIYVLSKGQSGCHRLTPCVFTAALGPMACGQQSLNEMDILDVLWPDLPAFLSGGSLSAYMTATRGKDHPVSASRVAVMK
jgi:hypothetical protein